MRIKPNRCEHLPWYKAGLFEILGMPQPIRADLLAACCCICILPENGSINDVKLTLFFSLGRFVGLLPVW